MLITIIGIIVIVCALIGIVLSVCLVKTDPAELTVIAEFGAKPIGIIRPGWSLILWPFHTVFDHIDTTIITDNIPKFIMNCRVENGLAQDINAAGPPSQPYGIVAIESQEVSLAYRLDFPLTVAIERQLETYYRLISKNKKTGKMDTSRLTERLKDIIQDLFRRHMQSKSLLEAINLDPAVTRQIEIDLGRECANQEFPVQIVKLSVNAPFIPAEPTVRQALKNRAEHTLKMEADIVTAKANRELAKIDIDTADAKAKAQAISAQRLAETYGITQLPPAERVQAYLTREALETYKAIASSPGTKIVVGANILQEIGSALSAVGQRR